MEHTMINIVFIIAMLHGVPVFLIGIWSGSRLVLSVLAVLSIVIAISSGNQRYLSSDLTAVIIAWVCGLVVINETRRSQLVSEKPEVLATNIKVRGSANETGPIKITSYFGHAVAVALLLYFTSEARGMAAGFSLLLILGIVMHAIFKK